MQPRLNYTQIGNDAYKAMIGVERYFHNCSLTKVLLHLIKLRASQINGCAYCIDMHSKDARAAGETEQRLYALSAWRETPFFTEKERACLEWTEAVTLISDNHVPDELFEKVRPHLSDQELVDLTFAIATINAWNRLAISFRTPVGDYQPGQFNR